MDWPLRNPPYAPISHTIKKKTYISHSLHSSRAEALAPTDAALIATYTSHTAITPFLVRAECKSQPYWPTCISCKICNTDMLLIKPLLSRAETRILDGFMIRAHRAAAINEIRNRKHIHKHGNSLLNLHSSVLAIPLNSNIAAHDHTNCKQRINVIHWNKCYARHDDDG